MSVTKSFDDVVAVDDLTLEIPHGSFFALLGPSGCGKTTTLRMIGGFEEPTAGAIYLGDREVSGLPPYKRDVNTVFQSYALFPHLSIFENVAFGLRRRGVRGGELRTRVEEMLELVGLDGLGGRKPRQLSGGQQQRVALARALVNRPRVLLLDEPLGALDLKLRKQMQLELKRIQHEVGITFVHVTHDQDEAMTMADPIVVMNGGRIEQLGSPTELYEQPRTAFVAGFLGVSNLLPGVVVRDRPRAAPDGGGEVLVPAARSRPPRASASVSASGRRSSVRSAQAPTSLAGAIAERVYVGVSTQYVVDDPRRRQSASTSRTTAPGAGAAAPGDAAHPQLEPGTPPSSSMTEEATDMTERITRTDVASPCRGRRRAAHGPRPARRLRRSESAATTAGSRGQTLPKTLTFSNWPLYIDVNEKTKTHPTLVAVREASTASTSSTSRTSTTTTSFFGKIEGPLSQGQSIGRDLIVMTDSSGLPGALDRSSAGSRSSTSRRSRTSRTCSPLSSTRAWDPNREYSLPWQSGMTGIGYDPKLGRRHVTSVDKLLTDPKLKGKVTMLTEMADSIGVAMLANGDDPGEGHRRRRSTARSQTIQKAVSSGQIRQFTGNDYAPLLAKGDIWACLRLVGRHGAAPGRPSGPQVGRCRRRAG